MGRGNSREGGGGGGVDSWRQKVLTRVAARSRQEERGGEPLSAHDYSPNPFDQEPRPYSYAAGDAS